jgi:SUMO ligase MMS21 Smc5/6 complex component
MKKIGYIIFSYCLIAGSLSAVENNYFSLTTEADKLVRNSPWIINKQFECLIDLIKNPSNIGKSTKVLHMDIIHLITQNVKWGKLKAANLECEYYNETNILMLQYQATGNDEILDKILIRGRIFETQCAIKLDKYYTDVFNKAIKEACIAIVRALQNASLHNS